MPRYVKSDSPNSFWSAAGPPGCWEWQGARTKEGGYGVARFYRKFYRAHRKAWELLNGPIPEGMMVLHRCNTPACVRPDHLYLGTATDNAIDRAYRNRQPKHTWKLSPADATEIRARYATGTISQTELGRAFGVAQSAISAIVRGKTYRNDLPMNANRTRP